jgi:hypothetical protein
MFISKIRPLVVPQHEHGRMAGLIASLWGNDVFERPSLDFDAFVKGVALHDWGYGLIDNLPIGAAPEKDWLDVIRRGYGYHFEHPVTDVIVKMHIRRLLEFKDSQERHEAIEALDMLIQQRLLESGHALRDFEWADRITNFCDFIAFDFAFEKEIDRSFMVFPRADSTETREIRVTSDLEGCIKMDPWPLQVDAYQGFIYAYEQNGYPHHLKPVVRKFRLVKN